MWTWLLLPMLELASVDLKGNKLHALPTMRLDNSNIWRIFYSLMEERLTAEMHTWSATYSIRTSSLYCRNSGMDLHQLSEASHSTSHGCISCTIFCSRHSPSCGMPSSIKNILKKNYWAILNILKLDWKVSLIQNLLIKFNFRSKFWKVQILAVDILWCLSDPTVADRYLPLNGRK